MLSPLVEPNAFTSSRHAKSKPQMFEEVSINSEVRAKQVINTMQIDGARNINVSTETLSNPITNYPKISSPSSVDQNHLPINQSFSDPTA